MKLSVGRHGRVGGAKVRKKEEKTGGKSRVLMVEKSGLAQRHAANQSVRFALSGVSGDCVSRPARRPTTACSNPPLTLFTSGTLMMESIENSLGVTARIVPTLVHWCKIGHGT